MARAQRRARKASVLPVAVRMRADSPTRGRVADRRSSVIVPVDRVATSTKQA